MTSRARAITLVLLVACLFTGGLAAIAGSAVAKTAVSPTTTAKTTQEPNLLLNPDGTAGATSAQGWDAVTIPGWQVQAGLPTVVRYGTAGFPKTTGTWPASRGNLFVGGAGGTASLVQVVRLAAAAPGARYAVSAWLGGTKTSTATLKVRFLDAKGHVLAAAAIGPVGGTARAVLADRSASGTVPSGATQAKITLVLATTLTDYNGPSAPQVGYDYATAADLSLALSSAAAAQPATLTPPASSVPSYQHVFLFYFENEDYNQVIGNTSQAPYLNSLRAQGATLTNFYAEEHPSDANYLAFAGGSTFGVPLDDPEEENNLSTIDAPNIGDLINAKGETWKAYTQSSNGACDDTVHGYYWDDDQPMLYFKDVRDNPSYCASHVVPLEELNGDLAHAGTTPNFAWVSPDDCSDMEGCGIAAGDAFLKTELTEIMNSPAWRTQRSLAIITFDEDAQDYQHPAQRVPTIVLASSGVQGGTTDSTRYTHYSLLRTVEGALGLGSLTANDRYAQPFNKVFTAGQVSTPVSPAPVAPEAAAPAAPAADTAAPDDGAFLASATAAREPVGWVANYGDGTVTPVNLTTRKASKAIPVGPGPRAILATPGGTTVYVADSESDTVTPINAATGKPGKPIQVGDNPWALAMTPDGRTLYVANDGSDTVTPVVAATNTPGPPIPVGGDPRAIAITPDGRTAYVLNWLSGTVTPVATATSTAGPPVRVGASPSAFAFSPDASTLYVSSFGGDSVTSIDTRTGRRGHAVPAGYAPDALAATGTGVYAVDGNSDELTRLGSEQETDVGNSPTAIAVSGTTAYVANAIDSTVTPVNLTTGKAAAALPVGTYTYPTAIILSGDTAIVIEPYGDSISLIDTRTNHVYAPIPVGAFPGAVTVTG
jgi:YVTN family beta-propeller protein